MEMPVGTPGSHAATQGPRKSHSCIAERIALTAAYITIDSKLKTKTDLDIAALHIRRYAHPIVIREAVHGKRQGRAATRMTGLGPEHGLVPRETERQ